MDNQLYAGIRLSLADYQRHTGAQGLEKRHSPKCKIDNGSDQLEESNDDLSEYLQSVVSDFDDMWQIAKANCKNHDQ